MNKEHTQSAAESTQSASKKKETQIAEKASAKKSPPSKALHKLEDAITKIRTEIGKIIVGQDAFIDMIICALLAKGHVLIEGVPGVAKTLTARLLAQSLDVDFTRIQFTPDLMPSDVLGTSFFNLKTNKFEFKKGPIFSQVALIDEINRAPAKTQAAMFECMQEKQVTVDGKTHQLTDPFIVLATQNPIEHEGTYQLPEAQLDRFLFKVNVDYPTEKQEVEILTRIQSGGIQLDAKNINPVLTAKNLLSLRKEVEKVHIEEKLIKYIAAIVAQTRNHKFLYLGASPRASIAILTGAKAFAAMQGRSFVTPDDVKHVAVPALCHRIQLTPEKEMEGLTLSQALNQIIDSQEVPR